MQIYDQISKSKKLKLICKTASKDVCNGLVKLNGVEFKCKCLFNEDAKIIPKVVNPTKYNKFYIS